MSESIQTQADIIIDRAIERHGGLARWNEVDTVVVKVYTLGGFGMSRRGIGKDFPMPTLVELRLKDKVGIFYDYPKKGRQSIYDNGKVAEFATGDTPVFENDNHREKMMSVSRFRRPWTTEDAIYFFGYAMLHYGTLPYSLKGLKVVGLKRRTSGDWRSRIDVEYPDGAHTHSKIETYYFDETNLLIRHDYFPEVSSPIARAANYLVEYKDFDGYLVTERRQVFFRLGRFKTPLVVLDGGIRVLEVRDKKENQHTAAELVKPDSVLI